MTIPLDVVALLIYAQRAKSLINYFDFSLNCHRDFVLWISCELSCEVFVDVLCNVLRLFVNVLRIVCGFL